jgi:uncharacterized protein (TIGR02246 family)
LGKAASGFAAAAPAAELSVVSANRAIYASYLQMGRRLYCAAPCLREPQLNRNYFMNKTIVMISVALTLALVSSCFSFAADMGPEERAIRKDAKEFADAYNQGNAEALASQWTKDGEYSVGQQTVKGRDTIAKLYTAFFKANPGSKMEVKVTSVRVIAPTVALEEGTATVTGSANGPASASSYSAVHVKQGDKWPMVSVHESEAPAVQMDRDLKELDWLIGEWTAAKDGNKATLDCSWMTEKRFLRVKITMSGKNGELPGGTQIIGRDPATGQLLSWFFAADGGYGSGRWQKIGSRWVIRTAGMAAEGAPTMATNVIYRADKNVISWQSLNRRRGDTTLPNIKEVVLERVQSKN